MWGFDSETMRHPINRARRWMRDSISSPEAPESSDSDTMAPGYMTTSITEYEALAFSASTSPTSDYMTASITSLGALDSLDIAITAANYMRASITSLEALDSADIATIVDKGGHVSFMPPEILAMIIEQTIIPDDDDDYDEYDLTCRLVCRRFAEVAEEVMGSLHRHNKCKLPNTIKYDRSTESRAIMAAVSSVPRFAALITEVACGTLSEKDIPRPVNLETALSRLATSLETVLSRLPNLIKLTCNRRDTSDDDDDDDEVNLEDLYWSSLCDIAHAAHNLAKINTPLKLNTINIRVGPWLHLMDERSQRDLRAVFTSIKHLRVDFVRDRTARVRAHKRSSRNHLWDRNNIATWPAYYRTEIEEERAWEDLLQSTEHNLESLKFAGHDTFGCVERRIEDVITKMRWKRLERFTIEIGQAEQDGLVKFVQAHKLLTYVDLRYLKLYQVDATWEGVPRMRQVRVLIGGELRVIRETQEDRDRRAARRQANKVGYDVELDFLENDDDFADDEDEDKDEDEDEVEDGDDEENDQTDDEEELLHSPHLRRSFAPSPPTATQRQSEQDYEQHQDQDRGQHRDQNDESDTDPSGSSAPVSPRPRAHPRTIFDYDSEDTWPPSDSDSDSDADHARLFAFVDVEPTYTSLDTVSQGSMISFIDALTELKSAQPLLQTVRVIVRTGWIHQSHELLHHWLAGWRERLAEGGGHFASEEGKRRWEESLLEMECVGFAERVAWDLGPL